MGHYYRWDYKNQNEKDEILAKIDNYLRYEEEHEGYDKMIELKEWFDAQLPE